MRAALHLALLAACAALYPRDAGGRIVAACTPPAAPSSLVLGARQGCAMMSTLRVRGGMGDSAGVVLAGETEELPALSAELRARVEAAVQGHWKVRTSLESL